MAATALTDRYAANLHGVLSCYDRIIITGTLPARVKVLVASFMQPMAEYFRGARPQRRWSRVPG
jgi:hypothetical protein